jgi:hypothetical protein
MRAKGPKFVFWFLIVVTAMVNPACSAGQRTIPTATEASMERQTLPPETPTVRARPTGTPTLITPVMSVTVLPTLASVKITAVKGNLFIRRGPDLSFNPVSVLMDGQSAEALARDVLAEWVQISIPGDPQKTGWISVQSHYSVVSGEVTDLPENQPTYWPDPAYLQNCTHHQMQVDPGEILLPAVDYFPENDVRVDPGIYTVSDTDVDGSPVVLTVEIREGSEIDIREDGSGERRKCPE